MVARTSAHAIPLMAAHHAESVCLPCCWTPSVETTVHMVCGHAVPTNKADCMPNRALLELHLLPARPVQCQKYMLLHG